MLSIWETKVKTYRDRNWPAQPSLQKCQVTSGGKWCFSRTKLKPLLMHEKVTIRKWSLASDRAYSRNWGHACGREKKALVKPILWKNEVHKFLWENLQVPTRKEFISLCLIWINRNQAHNWGGGGGEEGGRPSMQNVILRVSRRKNTKTFPSGAFFFMCFYRTALIPQNLRCPEKILVARLITSLLQKLFTEHLLLL